MICSTAYQKKLDLDVHVKTFHKLGLEIIEGKYKKRPQIQADAQSIINGFFKESIFKSDKYIYMFVDFLAYYQQVYKTASDFEQVKDFNAYRLSLDLETMRSKYGSNSIKELVKNHNELIIANYLFVHGLDYDYNFSYKNPSRNQYKSTFYLSKYDLYIEYFALDSEGHTPGLTGIEIR